MSFLHPPPILAGRAAAVVLCAGFTVLASTGTALAHAYPKTSDPPSNARLDIPPAHIAISYDSAIDARGSSMLLDSSGATVAAALSGTAQAQTAAADLQASLTVTAVDDGGNTSCRGTTSRVMMATQMMDRLCSPWLVHRRKRPLPRPRRIRLPRRPMQRRRPNRMSALKAAWTTALSPRASPISESIPTASGRQSASNTRARVMKTSSTSTSALVWVCSHP